MSCRTWRLASILVGVTLVLASRAVGQSVQPAEALPASRPANAFTVATYNINYGNADLAAVAQSIRACGADVVSLQETTDEAEKFIRRELRGLYPRMVFRNDTWAGGFGWLSKVPLTNVRYAPPKPNSGFFGTYLARARLAGRDVQLVGVHLKATLPNGKGLADYVQRIRRDDVIRAAEVTHIMSLLTDDMPVVLLGDLNSTSLLPAPQMLIGRGMLDSFAAANAQTPDQPTWHWHYRGMEWRFRLDYIFHSPQLATQASRVIEGNGSDHYLLVSTLGWVSEQGEATSQPTEEPVADR